MGPHELRLRPRLRLKNRWIGALTRRVSNGTCAAVRLSRRHIMKKMIITTVLGFGIAALLPAGCVPGAGAANTPAPAPAAHVAAHG